MSSKEDLKIIESFVMKLFIIILLEKWSDWGSDIKFSLKIGKNKQRKYNTKRMQLSRSKVWLIITRFNLETSNYEIIDV